jgi:hypothetical protein
MYISECITREDRAIEYKYILVYYTYLFYDKAMQFHKKKQTNLLHCSKYLKKNQLKCVILLQNIWNYVADL